MLALCLIPTIYHLLTSGIKTSPGTVVGVLDNEATLTCVISGPVPSSVQWYHESSEVSDSSRHTKRVEIVEGETRGTLAITSLELADKGNYNCKVTYDSGTVVESVTGNLEIYCESFFYFPLCYDVNLEA